MERWMADCRRFESDSNCQLTIIGPQDAVVIAAAQRARASHGDATHQSCATRSQHARARSAYVAMERTPEPFPA